MYPVSAAYKEAIKQNVRDVKITGTITLKDETVINITDDDIVLGSLYFSEQCVSGEDIEIGNVYASELGLALTSPPLDPYSLDGARIIINFGINVEPDPEEDPIWEYVPLGYFYVTEIERKQTTVNLKALDGMILFDVDLSGVLTTGTPYALIQSCCTKAGVTLANDSGNFEGYANGLSAFTIPDESKIETCRDLIMWLCQLTGTFARMNRAGQLEIIPVTAGASVKTISKQERFTSEVSDFYVKITKVAMKVGETEYFSGTDGMTLTLEENPLLAGKSEAEINAALAEILAQVTEAEYTPYSLTFAGDPALQAGDWVTLKDTGTLGGGDVVSIITHTTWRYRGPHEIRAAGKSGLLRGVQAQQQKTVSSIRAIAKAAQDLAQAANQSTQLINDAIGGHVLIRQSPDEGETNEILIMDNPDPELATKIWRWNMGGLGYSDNVTGADNPAREYDVAMTMDGAINADFVRTGTISSGVAFMGQLIAVSGTFEHLMAGNPFGARLELGESAGEPFLEAYDSANDLRVKLLQDSLEFSAGGITGGKLEAEYFGAGGEEDRAGLLLSSTYSIKMLAFYYAWMETYGAAVQCVGESVAAWADRVISLGAPEIDIYGDIKLNGNKLQNFAYADDASARTTTFQEYTGDYNLLLDIYVTAGEYYMVQLDGAFWVTNGGTRVAAYIDVVSGATRVSGSSYIFSTSTATNGYSGSVTNIFRATTTGQITFYMRWRVWGELGIGNCQYRSMKAWRIG